MARELNEIDLRIIELFKRGFTTNAIGNEVGKTKNAICGLLNRYREWGNLEIKRYNKPIVIKIKKQNVVSLFKKRKVIKNTQSSPLPPPVPPITDGIKFHKLKRTSCRYVINDGRPENFLFCGAPIHNRAYCVYHASICYVPNIKTFRKTA